MTLAEARPVAVSRRPRVVSGAVGAALLLLSAALQLVASLERWVGARGSVPDEAIEDHRFDYVVPLEPWQNVGAAAQWFGLGSLALAAGIAVLALGTRRTRARTVLVALAAGSFALTGVHAVASGVLGVPSALAGVVSSLPAFGIQLVAVVALGVLILRSDRLRGLAILLPAGSTFAGLLVAMFLIAPALAGYLSYDTTPWSETVVAVWTAVAALVAAAAAVRRPVENPDPA